MDGAGPATTDPVELVLSRTWRPALEITGAGGLPEIGNAGNVARPRTDAKVSLRLPPTCDPQAAAETVRDLLEREPPHGARVRFSSDHAAPRLGGARHRPVARPRGTPRLLGVLRSRGGVHGRRGNDPVHGDARRAVPAGRSSSSPGCSGPESNAHGPNEFLHIPTGKRLTCCVAEVIAAHHARPAVR